MMTKFKPGDVVEWKPAFRRLLRETGSDQHAREFSGCYGVVIGLFDCDGHLGPELDVRWQPSNLRYAYLPEQLQPAKRKLRGVWRRARAKLRLATGNPTMRLRATRRGACRLLANLAVPVQELRSKL